MIFSVELYSLANVRQVWSFAPTEEILAERSCSSSRNSLGGRAELGARRSIDAVENSDVVMSDDSGERAAMARDLRGETYSQGEASSSKD